MWLFSGTQATTHTHTQMSYIKWRFFRFALDVQRFISQPHHTFHAYLRTVCITFWFHKWVSPRRSFSLFFAFFWGWRATLLVFLEPCTMPTIQTLSKYQHIASTKVYSQSETHRQNFVISLSLLIPRFCLCRCNEIRWHFAFDKLLLRYSLSIFPFNFHSVDYWVRWSNYIDRLL